MGYADDLIAILDRAEVAVNELPEFSTVIRGWKAPSDDVKEMPTCFIVLRLDKLKNQMGATAENRTVTLEFWTLNNESHDTAIVLAGAIVDRLEQDLTLGGSCAWILADSTEYYVNVLKGYKLNWSKATFLAERRRVR